MRGVSVIVALGACAVLLTVLGARFGHVAALAGLGLACAGGLVVADWPGRRDSTVPTDEGGST